jgi:hypothetical protein
MLWGFVIQIVAILFLAIDASKVSATFLDVMKEICHWKIRTYNKYINIFTVVSAIFLLIAGPVAFKIKADEEDSNAKPLEHDANKPEKIGQNVNLATSQPLTPATPSTPSTPSVPSASLRLINNIC